jgi:hypothetical protein
MLSNTSSTENIDYTQIQFPFHCDPVFCHIESMSQFMIEIKTHTKLDSGQQGLEFM